MRHKVRLEFSSTNADTRNLTVTETSDISGHLSDGDNTESEYDEEESLSTDTKKTVNTDAVKQTSSDLPNRPISKEMMRNKGIVKYRHKRERNPRVHLRPKFRKATIRYRSRVAPVRKEEKPYGGELKGIRVNLVKSHKFKKY
uniref:Sas10 C-terminal domain-containing protein n=1 Tax=Trichobilharzia regenti TaxID=157069 RepID=A0AA85K431_TRIRE|nr:unnamed protein product [Trichobilharzia regenti]